MRGGLSRRELLAAAGAGVAVVATTGPAASAAPAAQADPPPVSAAEYFEQAMGDGGLHTPETGEQWAWIAAYYIDYFLRGYRAYGDTAWLDQAVRYYDFLLSRQLRAPDGYLGWIGPYIYDGSVWADVHISDGILFAPMMDFARTVLDDRDLRPTYGAKAREYVRHARKHVMEKWDRRDTWREDGPYGVYNYWDHFFEPGDLDSFVVRGDVEWANTSQQFNKIMRLGLVALRLYQVTGDVRYRRKVEKIFAFHKSRLQLHDGYYVWNYREPFGQWDVVDVASGDLATWVAVHPTRDYQNGEVSDVVDVYNAGLVYSEQDIARIITTNLEVMWNGDLDSPGFVNSNAGIWPDGQPYTDTAGTLWSALAQFDPTVRTLAEKLTWNGNPSDRRGLIDLAYLENVTNARSPSFDRLDVEKHDRMRLFDFPFADTRYLNMAAVMPSVFRSGERVILAVKAITPGQVRTSVYSDDGRHELVVVDERRVEGGTDGRQGVLTLWWDGTDATGKPLRAGHYRVRWTFDGGQHREFPIVIRHG